MNMYTLLSVSRHAGINHPLYSAEHTVKKRAAENTSPLEKETVENISVCHSLILKLSDKIYNEDYFLHQAVMLHCNVLDKAITSDLTIDKTHVCELKKMILECFHTVSFFQETIQSHIPAILNSLDTQLHSYMSQDQIEKIETIYRQFFSYLRTFADFLLSTQDRYTVMFRQREKLFGEMNSMLLTISLILNEYVCKMNILELIKTQAVFNTKSILSN